MKQKSTLFFLGLVILSVTYALIYTFTQSDNISQSSTHTVQNSSVDNATDLQDDDLSQTVVNNTTFKKASINSAPLPEDMFWKIFISVEMILVGFLLYHFYGKYRKSDSGMKLVRANIKALREEKLVATYQDEAITKVRIGLRKKRFPVKDSSDLVKYAKKLEISTGEIQLVNKLHAMANK